MAFQNTITRLVLLTALLTGMSGTIPVQASGRDQDEQACRPAESWMWVNGYEEPDAAIRVQQELGAQGIESRVEATGYGEMDNCGTYEQRGIDFVIRLEAEYQPGLEEKLLPILMNYGKPLLGNVKLFSADGQDISAQLQSERSALESAQVNSFGMGALSGEPITRKVYVIVYDPLLSNGKTLTKHVGWNDPAILTQQTVDFFRQATNNKMNYEIVETTTVTSGWPRLVDGFKYTESQYMAVLANSLLHHEPTGVDYNYIVNSAEFDICGKVNRGEIDEVWLYGGPWFGYWESTLVGPGAYYYNSFPVPGPHNCNRLIPIMGPSFERGLSEAVHNFGHRAEATMEKVYGGWQQNSTSHNWNKFGLAKFQSPSYSYSGCGSIHYPPNATSEYAYSSSASVLSNCDDFLNYPNLSDPLQVVQPVTCSAWGCTHLGFLGYWFGHIPSASGCGPDNVANDWWKYLAFPENALHPSFGCQPDKHLISGNIGGMANVILSYTDGGLKIGITDAYGNYSLLVSNHWSGTITPFRSTYTFNPASIQYVDVQSDQYEQNYTAKGGGPIVRPDTPAQLLPANGVLLSSLRPVFDWTDSNPITFYHELQISENSSFDVLAIPVDMLALSAYTPSTDLTPGKLYYWRVKTYDADFYNSRWSSVWTFKTPLARPMLASPSNGESLFADRPSFDWDDVPGAASYVLEVSRFDNFSSLLINEQVRGTEYTTPMDLPQNRTFYWRTRARTSDATGPWSATGSFKTGNPPTVPVPASPATGTLLRDYTPLFNWKNSTLPIDTSFQYYEIQVDDTKDFFSPEIQGTTTPNDITDSDFTPLSNLPPNTKFYWRVRAVNTDNHVSGWSPVWTLRTFIQAPQSLIMIPNLSKPRQPSLAWDDAFGPITSYRIQISTSASFTTLLVNGTTSVSAYTMTKNLPAGRMIYWRVRVNGINGPSPWTIAQFMTP